MLSKFKPYSIELLSRNVDEKWNYKQTIEIHYSPYVSLIHHHLQAVQRSGWMEIVQGVEFAEFGSVSLTMVNLHSIYI